MPKLSTNSTSMPASSIREMARLCNGIDNLISFVYGEPDFITPQYIIDAGIEALKQGKTHYTPNAGIPELRKAISDAYNSRNLDYSPNEIVITNGAVNALILSLMAIVDPGDEIIISDPYWSNYYGMIMQVGGKPVPVPVREKDNFMFDVDNLDSAITSKTKAILINSPSNPTGSVANKINLKRISKLAIKKDIFIVTDEIYRQLIYTDNDYISISSFKGMKERTIIVDGFSKTYAMTGWRIGYVAAPLNIAIAITKLLENVISCVSATSQYAAIAAITETSEPVDFMRKQYKKRRDILVSRINSINKLNCIKPEGTFYAFVNIKETGLNSKDFAIQLLKEKHVAVVPGSGFGEGGEGFIRISFATSEQNIIEGLSRLKEFVENVI